MSSFTVSGHTAATFNTKIDGSNRQAGVLKEIVLGLRFPDYSGWDALANLRSWNVNVQAMPGATDASDVNVDIGGGVGSGTLVVDGLGTFTAILTDLTENRYLSGSRVHATGTWLVTA